MKGNSSGRACIYEYIHTPAINVLFTTLSVKQIVMKGYKFAIVKIKLLVVTCNPALIFVASPFAGKPLSNTQTTIRGGERCAYVREAA